MVAELTKISSAVLWTSSGCSDSSNRRTNWCSRSRGLPGSTEPSRSAARAAAAAR